MSLFGNWSKTSEPSWEIELEKAPESIIKETKMSRDKLKEVLNILYENRIIN